MPRERIAGTVQNDILKEYIARGTYIFPPRASMRLVTDVFEFCAAELPRWNTISISGYHMREAGATAAQELAFTLADAIAYVDAAVARGLDVDDFAGRLSFFFAAWSELFEEVAKFRAARRMWATIMKERFGATDPRSMVCRFHVQTAGSSLTAQSVDNNVVRTTIQALAAVLGGAQSLHTNSRDEALALPTEEAARLALRTQQIIAHEAGVTDTPDPLAGSFYIESLTNELEAAAWAYLDEIESMGGTLAAIEHGFQQRQIQEAAYRVQRAVESGDQIVVGVNKFRDDDVRTPKLQKIDPDGERRQVERVRRVRAERSAEAWTAAMDELERVARADGNLMPSILVAVRAYATVGEISDRLRGLGRAPRAHHGLMVGEGGALAYPARALGLASDALRPLGIEAACPGTPYVRARGAQADASAGLGDLRQRRARIGWMQRRPQHWGAGVFALHREPHRRVRHRIDPDRDAEGWLTVLVRAYPDGRGSDRAARRARRGDGRGRSTAGDGDAGGDGRPGVGPDRPLIRKPSCVRPTDPAGSAIADASDRRAAPRSPRWHRSVGRMGVRARQHRRCHRAGPRQTRPSSGAARSCRTHPHTAGSPGIEPR